MRRGLQNVTAVILASMCFSIGAVPTIISLIGDCLGSRLNTDYSTKIRNMPFPKCTNDPQPRLLSQFSTELYEHGTKKQPA